MSLDFLFSPPTIGLFEISQLPDMSIFLYKKIFALLHPQFGLSIKLLTDRKNNWLLVVSDFLKKNTKKSDEIVSNTNLKKIEKNYFNKKFEEKLD